MDWLLGGRRGKSERVGWQEGESQLDSVRRQLRENPAVFVAGEVHDTNPGPGYFRETHDIFVAPTQPIFRADKLNIFMNGLVNGIDPVSVDKVDNTGGLSIGTLYFDEMIDPYFSQRGERRVWVRVFPKSNIASLVAEYQRSQHAGEIEPALENVRFDRLSHHLNEEQLRYIKTHDRLIDMASNGKRPLLR